MTDPYTRLVTGQQMARIDRRAISGGIPGETLMETAGCSTTRVVRDLLGGLQNRKVVLLCGKGNNGGDGFVVARQAARGGANVQIFLVAPAAEVLGDARVNLNRVRDLNLSVAEILIPEALERARQALSNAHVAVDALLGTGIRGGARGLVAEAIRLLDKATCPVVAVDVPSGMDADTGRAEGACAAATCTVTFGQPKRGHVFYPGKALTGALHWADIGIPQAAVEAEGVETSLIAPLGAAALLPQRAPDAHKGDCGRVAILAGSVGLTGAAALSARAALRSGAGLVTLGVPESLNDILEAKLTEAMTRALPEVRKARCLSLRARGDIGRFIADANCVALGPGLGTHRETVELLRRLVPDLRIPGILDADALNAFAGQVHLLAACQAPLVITPHPGEFCRLTGQEIAAVQADPIQAAQHLATDIGITVVLKGAPTVVATPQGKTFVNPSGNAGMATGGTGDVLTGLLAGLVGQGLGITQAACLSAYLHGLAGDMAAEMHGQAGLIAGDIVSALPAAEQRIRNGEDRNRYIHHHPLCAKS